MRRGREARDLSLFPHMHRGRAVWGQSEKVALYKLGRDALPETNPVGTMILDFQPLGLWENKYLLFKPPILQYFVVAALAN